MAQVTVDGLPIELQQAYRTVAKWVAEEHGRGEVWAARAVFGEGLAALLPRAEAYFAAAKKAAEEQAKAEAEAAAKKAAEPASESLPA
jgi:hypothetical protein